jgi:hypothetical protein
MSEHKPEGKHALRCETCNHHKIVGIIPDMYDECDILYHTPTREERRFVEMMGCASHSEACEISNALAIGKLKLLKERARKRSDEMMDIGHDGNWDSGKEEAFKIAIATICAECESDLIKGD